jgi:uncharacterized protein (DUF488 family)
MAARRSAKNSVAPPGAGKAVVASEGVLPRFAILTIGHSTRPIEEFVALLKQYSVERLVDVRTVRRSRFNPQFNEGDLSTSLEPFGVTYETSPNLGGLRKPRRDSRNLGWRNASFRGYADYMETPEFARGLADLMARSAHESTALMCAEAVPWRCHRSLIADALVLKGVEVRHILGPNSAARHRLTTFLVERAGRPTYPADPRVSSLDEFG